MDCVAAATARRMATEAGQAAAAAAAATHSTDPPAVLAEPVDRQTDYNSLAEPGTDDLFDISSLSSDSE